MPSAAMRSDTRLSRLPIPAAGLEFRGTPRSTLSGVGGVEGADGDVMSKPTIFSVRFGPVAASTQAT